MPNIKISACIICFVAGVAVTIGAALFLTRHAGDKLNADLASAGWTLATATRQNAELADGIRQLHLELDRANNLVSINQSIAESQQRKLGEQQRLIDGIASSIASQGGDIRSQIQGIADLARRLYAFYHPSPSGR